MKAMPFPFEELRGNGVLNFLSNSDSPLNWKSNCYVATEPTSVLDARRSPSPPTSTSTLSSLGGGCGGSTLASAAAPPDNSPLLEKCGLSMDDWDTVLPISPGQAPSILGFIMGDVEDDPSLGFNKLLQPESASQQDFDFTSNFGAVDHGFPFESIGPVSTSNPMFSGVFQTQNQHQMMEAMDEKPQIFNPQVVMNQNQNQNQTQFSQNPAMFMPVPYGSIQENHVLSPPPAKRFNSGSIGPNYQMKRPFHDSGQEMFGRRTAPQQVQLFPHHLQQRPLMTVAKQKMNQNEDMQGITDQLFKAVELIDSGNTVLAQGILARLNHQLSPIGKPFHRAAFYFKEALQLLLHSSNPSGLSPFNMIFKIAAYKSFSEVSPVLQFSNFTCNQALLESFNGFDRIHIIDFDIGYGGQWASLMQELALRNGGAPFLKITAFASTSTHDDFELGFTQENLKNFANDLNIGFELEVLNLESLNSGSWPLPLNVSENEAIAVNLPIGSFFNYSLSLPLVLRFIKHLSPKIVVSVDRGCTRMEAPFPHRIISALQSYSGLLESMDAIAVDSDTQLKIERYLLQPAIEKVVMSRNCGSERVLPWRSLFLSSGFSPMAFSNFTESQAECLVQRTPVQGFHVEKRQNSLVLGWQRKELVSISAWRC